MENRTTTHRPQHPQRRRILDALTKLREVIEYWDEDDVESYPPGLPSFDEFVAELRGKLLAIEWRHRPSCKSCGSEVVASVNDSTFGDGECGGCEYRRYRSQPSLLAAARTALDAMNGLAESAGYDPTWNQGGGTFEARQQLAQAIREYDGPARVSSSPTP